MLYGLLYLGRTTDLPIMETKDQFLRNCILAISPTLSSLRLKGLLTQTPPLESSVHHFQPGDLVTWLDKLQPSWEGPYQVLLTTKMAVETAEKGCTHYTQAKGLVRKAREKGKGTSGKYIGLLRNL
jgi:hypothetical protein